MDRIVRTIITLNKRKYSKLACPFIIKRFLKAIINPKNKTELQKTFSAFGNPVNVSLLTLEQYNL